MTPPAQPRVLVIALSEATLDLIVPWAKAGRLPTFQRLMNKGSWGPLRSRIPLITPQMWGTIVTGKSPGHHGAYDFWQRGPDGRFRAVTGSDLKAKPIWRILSERGLRYKRNVLAVSLVTTIILYADLSLSEARLFGLSLDRPESAHEEAAAWVVLLGILGYQWLLLGYYGLTDWHVWREAVCSKYGLTISYLLLRSIRPGPVSSSKTESVVVS